MAILVQEYKFKLKGGEFEAYEEWARLDTDGALGAQATQDFVE